MRNILLGMSLFLSAPSYVISSMPSSVNEWQWIDDDGLVFPWFTKPFLEVLRTWDIKDWEVFEWGTGYSTIWFAKHCKSVVSIETNPKWLVAIQERLDELQLSNVVLKQRNGSFPFDIGGGGEDSSLINSIDEDEKLYDCIVIDSIHRNTCAVYALKHIKPHGIIILDNANQFSVGLNSWTTFELLKEYPHYSYLQPGHRDWRTDYWIINRAPIR